MSAEQEPSGTRRGRPRDPQLRAQVLTAASRQLENAGYTAMTMEGILADTGIAKRTLYRWWPSKAAVVAEAILEGFVSVPENRIAHTEDVWEDLRNWLESVAVSVRGSYGEVLRAATAIGATDAALGESLTNAFARPARADVIARLQAAAKRGQVSPGADLDAVVDLLMAIIVYIGVSRDDAARIPGALGVIRLGIEP
ncbi:TetR/AcrR family transcriptional regulator [Leifsonia poae]|uniref:TetR/AcrR family transcriptional regulator n=1 Tax=Leifsonia poae TaxID=110933 RepID=UPI0022F247F1|nr:TetR/AcrR family transcriptional regulator [Leifsonia poae]